MLLGSVSELVHKAPSGLPGVLLDSLNTGESSFIGRVGERFCLSGLCGLGMPVVIAQPMPVVVDLAGCTALV